MNLIIPSVSCGNIPQLTVDLLIHSLDFSLVSRLDDSYLHPFASPVDHVEGQQVESGHVATAISSTDPRNSTQT
jgi:proteasome chaperone 2